MAKKVYQIEGGIHRYVEQYPDGFFRGKNYVFDGRIAVRVNDDVLSTCDRCNAACDDYTNCVNERCNTHFICCQKCRDIYQFTCSKKCHELVVAGVVPVRDPLIAYDPEGRGDEKPKACATE